MDEILKQAMKLIAAAEAADVVVTIPLVPKEPLAMGNYSMMAEVTPKQGY